MNNLSKIITAAVACFLLVTVTSVILISVYANPGDQSNPIIAKDYLDSVVASLVKEKNELEEKLASLTSDSESQKSELQSQIDALNSAVNAIPSNPINSEVFSSFSSEIDKQINSALNDIDKGFEILELQSGKTVTLSSGAEFIVRTGIVKAVTNSASDGLCDLSVGSIVANDNIIPASHYIVALRSDRGFVTESDSVIIIRGEYTVS